MAEKTLVFVLFGGSAGVAVAGSNRDRPEGIRLYVHRKETSCHPAVEVGSKRMGLYFFAKRPFDVRAGFTDNKQCRDFAREPVVSHTSFHSTVRTPAPANRFYSQESVFGCPHTFRHLYQQLAGLGDDASPATGFALLDSVSQTPGNGEPFPWNTETNDTITAWSIVFCPAERAILLKTHPNDAIRELRLSDFIFDADGEYLVMDIHAGASGPTAPSFASYSKEKNCHILRLAAPSIGLPEEALDGLVDAVDHLYRTRSMSHQG